MPNPDPRPSLAAELARADAATKGEWASVGTMVKTPPDDIRRMLTGAGEPVTTVRICLTDNEPYYIPLAEQEANADFIAHARTVCPAALGLIQRIKTEAVSCGCPACMVFVVMIDGEFAE